MNDLAQTALALIALEGRTVSGGKGKGTANSQRAQELDMQKQAFGTQQKQIKALQQAFSKYTVGSGQGFDPGALIGMRTQFLNSNNDTFNQAGQQVREALGARGEGMGVNPFSGSGVSGLSNLFGAKARSQSQGLLGVQVQDAMQALNNKFNAGNLLSGNAATLIGTQGVAGAGASSALGDYINAANKGFGNAFTSGFGSSLGSGLGSFVSGGLGKAAGMGG